jgi:tryptophanyl-tRNA synthetase
LAFQERRAKVTDEIVKQYMERKPLQYKGNPQAPIVVPKVEGNIENAEGAEGDGKVSKNQLKKLQKQKEAEAKKAAKAVEKAAKTEGAA